jgi:biopolymer transport protein ExbD
MAQIDTSGGGGKKKKGAQKKMQIHVDFTPMVDMNMLLITFFMLCTTMIQSRTMQIILPSNDKNIKEEQKNQASADEAVTLILDTEYNEETLQPKHDENGNTLHRIYYYEGIPDTVNVNVDGQKAVSKSAIQLERFVANEGGVQKGIRAILRDRHKDVMTKYDELKTKWKNKEITKEQFEEQAKANATDENLKHPVVIIKPGPNATYESLIYAIDELNLNQIRKYSIQMPDKKDSVLLNNFGKANPKLEVMRNNIRK